MNAIVLKLGGSVLVDVDACADLVHEVYRHYRSGRRVLAVCSAFKGQTDSLLQTASLVNGRSDHYATAAFVQTGEQQAAACFALACDAAGLPVKLLDAAQIGLEADGLPLDAIPTSVRTDEIRSALRDYAVVVVPGFCARDRTGQAVLLGRGGSDLTAVFLAHQLGYACHLVKDVDGWYNQGRRFDNLSFADAIALGDPVVQEKALEYADRTATRFTIGSPRSRVATKIDNVVTEYARAGVVSPRVQRVAILGVGTVGAGVWRHIDGDPRFEITCGLVGPLRPGSRRRPGWVDAGRLTTNHDFPLDCDIVVEALPDAVLALPHVDRALRAGVHVVSANKDLIAHHGRRLAALAESSGARLEYSAAVGGACPALETARRLAGHGNIVRVRGVLNATTNVVLSEIRNGRTLPEAIDVARRRGFAEADPTSDLSGRDAANKLVLIARELTGTWISPGSVETVSLDQARLDTGEWIRQVADLRIERLNDGRIAGVHASVTVESLPESDPLAHIAADWNAVHFYDSSHQVDLAVVGRGAGEGPTSASMFADVLSLPPSPALQPKALVA